MKKARLIILIAVIAISGCARKSLTENEFTVIWQEYLQREFEESFDEKQSVFQKEKTLGGLLSGYNIDIEEFKLYLKKNHLDKYNKIFVE